MKMRSFVRLNLVIIYPFLYPMPYHARGLLGRSLNLWLDYAFQPRRLKYGW